MAIYLIQIVSLFVLSFIMINAYFIIADRFDIIDKPNHRSSHTSITIRGGGVIIPVMLIIYELINHVPDVCFFSGLVLISSVSFWDDVKNISAKVRLTVQVIAVILMLADTDVSDIAAIIPAVIIITGFINGYNFMDGINGITGIYSFILTVSLMYVAHYVTVFYDGGIYIYIIIPLLTFLSYNFRKKAKCFAGDVGAVSLAYILSFLLFHLISKTGNVLFLLFVAVYGIDIVITIIQRLLLKQNIFEAHRMHLYQILANEAGWSHRNVSLIYGGIQLTINVIVLFVINMGFSGITQLIFFVGITLLLVLIYSYVKFIALGKYTRDNIRS